MRTDAYAKAVLTVIVLLLIVVAYKLLVRSDAAPIPVVKGPKGTTGVPIVAAAAAEPTPPASTEKDKEGRESGVAADANAEAHRLWDKLLTRCGDSYYYYLWGDVRDVRGNQRVDALIVEYKNASFDFESLPVSEADKLNGVQWAGYAIMFSRNYRPRTLGVDAASWGKWGFWRDGTTRTKADANTHNSDSDGLNIVGMSKRRGSLSFAIPANPTNAPVMWMNGDFNQDGLWSRAHSWEPRVRGTPDDIARKKLSCEAVIAANPASRQ